MTNNEIDYGIDPLGRHRFWGIYSGKVVDIKDPLKKKRIKVTVDQPFGTSKTNWAEACLPITSNSNHPDHLEHTAAQVAALLTNHSTTITSSSVNDGGVGANAHSHTVTLNLAHAGNNDELDHAHKTTFNSTELWNDSQETNTTDEHTPHRLIPRVGQEVWIMFIAGDPEYPIWIGVRP
jgi:hypothetical protein